MIGGEVVNMWRGSNRGKPALDMWSVITGECSIKLLQPQRHSRNNTDAALFTYHERKEAGYGTQKLRYGADSQLPFGHCCLTLKPVEDPVVT